MKKKREKTKVVRVRESLHSALRVLSATSKKPMTILLEDMISPELKRHSLLTE